MRGIPLPGCGLRQNRPLTYHAPRTGTIQIAGSDSVPSSPLPACRAHHTLYHFSQGRKVKLTNQPRRFPDDRVSIPPLVPAKHPDGQRRSRQRAFKLLRPGLQVHLVWMQVHDSRTLAGHSPHRPPRERIRKVPQVPSPARRQGPAQHGDDRHRHFDDCLPARQVPPVNVARKPGPTIAPAGEREDAAVVMEAQVGQFLQRPGRLGTFVTGTGSLLQSARRGVNHYKNLAVRAAPRASGPPAGTSALQMSRAGLYWNGHLGPQPGHTARRGGSGATHEHPSTTTRSRHLG